VFLGDVIVLVYAHRMDAPRQSEYRDWLVSALSSESPIALPDLVLSGFLRIATHPRIFPNPTPMAAALRFSDAIREAPSRVTLAPGPGHWEIFRRLCRRAEVRGNLVADAYLAALAIGGGCELVTTDRDFARFEGLRGKHPLS
jgi:toxin-antitoxin system PIN domain toxin